MRARSPKSVVKLKTAGLLAIGPLGLTVVEQLKEIARLRAEGALTESEFQAVKARLLSDEASA